jgi:transposase
VPLVSRDRCTDKVPASRPTSVHLSPKISLRLLKDPMFLESTLYLKRVERVMAPLMVMSVPALVYAALEYRIRQTLAEHNESVPDQKGKPTRRPSAKKWVFELFMDVHLLTIATERIICTLVLNLREELKRLLELISYLFVITPQEQREERDTD